jgi:Uma2 family endonuclease
MTPSVSAGTKDMPDLDSSTGFLLANGAMRSPDLAWVLRE